MTLKKTISLIALLLLIAGSSRSICQSLIPDTNPSNQPNVGQCAYALPFDGSMKVTQAYFSEPSHQFENALDLIPIESPSGRPFCGIEPHGDPRCMTTMWDPQNNKNQQWAIRALRDGVVKHIDFDCHQNRAIADPNSPGWCESNSIFVEHDDGTWAAFWHVDAQSKTLPLAQLERRVKAGDQIAWLGTTGANGPHLHLTVHHGPVGHFVQKPETNTLAAQYFTDSECTVANPPIGGDIYYDGAGSINCAQQKVCTTPPKANCHITLNALQTNFGMDSHGGEHYYNAGLLDAAACQAEIGKNRGGGTVQYAALGDYWGCHTYLDFFPTTTALHGDNISNAWRSCPPPSTPACNVDTVLLQTNFGMDTNGNEHYFNAGPLSAEACQREIGKTRGGGIVKYAALGENWGCHTYLDIFTQTNAQHGDTISKAWLLCPLP